jgi:hypothetical protein
LHKHLKNCSPSRQDEAEQQILVATGDLSTSVIQGNFVIDQERSRVDIATMMIKHGYPLTMVQHEFFVKNFQPVFQLYSKDVVEADVLAICRQEKEKLINFFDKLSCLLSLTLELWSSTDKMKTYCCFTVHFCHDPNPGSMTGNAGAVAEGHPSRAKPHNGHIKRIIYSKIRSIS